MQTRSPGDTGSSSNSVDQPALLQLAGVTVERDNKQLVADIDWSVKPGQHWVVIGHNGCGKTTLVRLASFYLHPTRGLVRVMGDGLGTCDIRTLRGRIPVISSATERLFRPTIDAVDLVMCAKFGALEPWWHTYTTVDRDAALGCLSQTGAEGIAERPFGTLSSGERQRVMWARALMADAPIMLLDEPASGLDFGARERLLADLDAMFAARPEMGSVFVTHHVEEIPRSATHLLAMSAGRIVAAGPIATTLTPETLSTAVGIDCTITMIDGRYFARAT